MVKNNDEYEGGSSNTLGSCGHSKCPRKRITGLERAYTDLDLDRGTSGGRFCSEPDCPARRAGF